MSSDWKGEFLSVTRFCGSVHDLAKTGSRSMFQLNHNSTYIVLSKREAEELIILLQAALIDWKGELGN